MASGRRPNYGAQRTEGTYPCTSTSLYLHRRTGLDYYSPMGTHTFTVALCGQKGGSGKTTLAVSLASEWHRRGLRVLLCDLDPQGTATVWGDVAAELGVNGPSVIGMGDSVRQQLPAVSNDYDVCVIDCPPRAGKRTVGALMVADLAVLPCGASPADVWALSEALEVVAQARELRPELDARIVMNAVLSTSTLGDEVRAVVGDLDLPIMSTIIHSRVALARTFATGQGVTCSEPGSIAALEVRRFVDEVEEALGMTEAAREAS